MDTDKLQHLHNSSHLSRFRCYSEYTYLMHSIFKQAEHPPNHLYFLVYINRRVQVESSKKYAPLVAVAIATICLLFRYYCNLHYAS